MFLSYEFVKHFLFLKNVSLYIHGYNDVTFKYGQVRLWSRIFLG